MPQSPDFAPDTFEDEVPHLKTTAEMISDLLTAKLVITEPRRFPGHGHRAEIRDDENPLGVFIPSADTDS